MSTSIQDLSFALATIIDTAGPAVVRVDAGPEPVSGIVWDTTTIVTVRHAIDDDAPISVALHDGSVHTAKVLGHDPRVDLTFLTVDGADLPARPAPATDAPHTGHLVLTLGRGARGLRSSLGIVSATGPAWRTRGGAELEVDIDVDATLHPTAAGGPLLDSSGLLLGLNTTGLRPGGATIPVATIDAALEYIRAHGSIQPGLLGVRVRTTPLPPDLAAQHGQHQGLLVLGTPRRSPAAKAGVEAGDVLLTVNGTPVHSLMDLRTTLSTAGGSQVTVVILRAGETRALDVPVLSANTFMRGWGRKGGGRRGPGRGRGRRGPWRRFRQAARRHHGKC